MHSSPLLPWQLEQLGCDCQIHRYQFAYLCRCGAVLNAPEARTATHQGHLQFAFDSMLYKHGDEMGMLFDRLHVMGKIPRRGSERYEQERARLGLQRLIP